jgi:hypothetical protein
MAGTTSSSFQGETAESTFDWSFGTPRNYQRSISTNGQDMEFVLIDGLQYSKSAASGNGVTIIVDDSVFSPVPSRDETLKLIDSLIAPEELE